MPPHKRANKRRKLQPRRAPVSQAQHVVVDQANVTVTGLAYERFKTWVPMFTGLAAMGAATVFIWNAWTWLGLPKVVAESTFHDSLQRVQSDFTSKIGETKQVVIQHSDKNTTLVKDDVGKVAKQVESLITGQQRADVRALELQQRQLFLQRSNLLNSISSVELQLRERPNDSFLVQRKAELDAIRSNIDREAETVNDQLRRARQGN